MTTHNLKTWPSVWEAVKRGEKRFEVRSNADRDFAVGDTLLLRKWDPDARYIPSGEQGNFIGKSGHADLFAWNADTLTCKVTYVMHGGRFGLPPGLCVMSIDVEEKS